MMHDLQEAELATDAVRWTTCLDYVMAGASHVPKHVSRGVTVSQGNLLRMRDLSCFPGGRQVRLGGDPSPLSYW